MNTDAIIEAEHDLYEKVYAGKILSKSEICSEINKIIAECIKNKSLNNFILYHKICVEELEFIYYHLFSCVDFFECFYIGKKKILFPTAVLLDDEALRFMDMQLRCYCCKAEVERKNVLYNVFMDGARFFFRREAVRRNIVNREFMQSRSLVV